VSTTWSLRMESKELTEHNVSIVHDERYLARPYGAVCSCGWISANVTEEEAEESKRNHLESKREQVEDQQVPSPTRGQI